VPGGLAVVFLATANLRAQTVAKAQEDYTKAREKLDAELKSTHAEKEEMAKALANSKAELNKIIADEITALSALQKVIEERNDEVNELWKKVDRLQDAQVAQKKKKQLAIDSLVVLVLVFVLVLAAVPWEMWISARQQPRPDGNNREGSSTRWMRMRAFLKRRWRCVAVPTVVVIWAIGATALSESRGSALYQRSQLLLPGMSREEVIKTMGSAPAETRQWPAIGGLAIGIPLEDPRNWAGIMSWEDDRWKTYVKLEQGKFVWAFSTDNNPKMVTRSFEWLHHHLNWSVTDKLWRWSL
jgi:hypothetical protein